MCIYIKIVLHTALSHQGKTLPWLVVGKKLRGQLLELKKGVDGNGKTGLNPSKDVRRSEIASQLSLLSKENTDF